MLEDYTVLQPYFLRSYEDEFQAYYAFQVLFSLCCFFLPSKLWYTLITASSHLHNEPWFPPPAPTAFSFCAISSTAVAGVILFFPTEGHIAHLENAWALAVCKPIASKKVLHHRHCSCPTYTYWDSWTSMRNVIYNRIWELLLDSDIFVISLHACLNIGFLMLCKVICSCSLQAKITLH